MYIDKRGKYRIHIKDYGSGIPNSEFESIFCVLGKSTKQTNTMSTGKFGLGCKSPFAVTNSYWIKNSDGETIKYYNLIHDETTIGSKSYTPEEFKELKIINNFYSDNHPGLEIEWSSEFKVATSKNDILLYLQLLNDHPNIRVKIVNHSNDSTTTKFESTKIGKNKIVKIDDLPFNFFEKQHIYLCQGTDIFDVTEYITSNKVVHYYDDSVIFIKGINKQFESLPNREELKINNQNVKDKLIIYLGKEYSKLINSILNKEDIRRTQLSKYDLLYESYQSILDIILDYRSRDPYKDTNNRVKQSLRTNQTIKFTTSLTDEYKEIIYRLCNNYPRNTSIYIYDLMLMLFKSSLHVSMLEHCCTQSPYKNVYTSTDHNLIMTGFRNVFFEFLSTVDHELCFNLPSININKVSSTTIKSRLRKKHGNKLILLISEKANSKAKINLSNVVKRIDNLKTASLNSNFNTKKINYFISRYPYLWNDTYNNEIFKTTTKSKAVVKTIKVKKKTRKELNDELIKYYHDPTNTKLKSNIYHKNTLENIVKALQYMYYDIGDIEPMYLPIPIFIVPNKIKHTMIYDYFEFHKIATELELSTEEKINTILLNNLFKTKQLFNINHENISESKILKLWNSRNQYDRNRPKYFLARYQHQTIKQLMFSHMNGIILDEKLFTHICKYCKINNINLKFKILNGFIRNKTLKNKMFNHLIRKSTKNDMFLNGCEPLINLYSGTTNCSGSLSLYGNYGHREFKGIYFNTNSRYYGVSIILDKDTLKNNKVVNMCTIKGATKLLEKTINIEKKYLSNIHTFPYIDRTYI